MSAYLQWKENGSNAEEASMVTSLALLGSNRIKENDIRLDKFVNLKRLYIGCGISTIPEDVYNLVKLVHLDVSENKIKEISPMINKLVNLRHLSCGGNNISSFPVEIRELHQLSEFYYSNNLLDVLHPDVIEFIYHVRQSRFPRSCMGHIRGSVMLPPL